jgi:ATPase subunit of ABC transporter with duplicated ATPase domains
MLTVSEVTKSYGGKTLFEDVTTSFEPGHRYGLTGRTVPASRRS